MKELTIILLNNNDKINDPSIEVIPYQEQTLKEDIQNSQGKYITFIKNIEDIQELYLEKVKNKCQEDFDSCFLNYTLEIKGKTVSNAILEEPEIIIKPYPGDYAWAFIFKKEKLLEFLKEEEQTKEKIDQIFVQNTYIEEIILHHKTSKNNLLKNFPYIDEKKEIYRDNIIYVESYCNALFNGYVTWINNIGKCFSKDYNITILYDELYEPTKLEFEKNLEVLQRQENINYVCDRLLVTYSTYFYAKNIIHLEENYLFIHGNMSDFENIRKYDKDNYTKYIAVSKVSAEKAKGFFPTDNIEYIRNPIKIEPNEIKPHLKLVSAHRNDAVKKENRVYTITNILEEEEIPYSWSIFTDFNSYERDVYGGVIYRPGVKNPYSYIQDADYYVQLSDSEAYSYSVLEALYLNTKVIVTPLECYQEMNIDKNQAIIIPFEYFEPENKEKLREILLKAYHKKNKKMQNKLSESMYDGYHNLFKKK